MNTFGEPLYRISQTKGNFSNKTMNSEKDYIAFDDRGPSKINGNFINITKTSNLKPSIIFTTSSFFRNY